MVSRDSIAFRIPKPVYTAITNTKVGGFPKLGVPFSKDSRILGSILGSLIQGNTQIPSIRLLDTWTLRALNPKRYLSLHTV